MLGTCGPMDIGDDSHPGYVNDLQYSNTTEAEINEQIGRQNNKLT